MSSSTRGAPSNFLTEAHGALAHGAWESARAWFEQAISQEETPEALEGLATAAWWQNDADTTLVSRVDAYRLYQQRSDRRGAARVAAFHAIDHCSLRHDPAIASGWIQRARRLIDGLEPGVEHAMIPIWEGHIALSTRRDTQRARELSQEAATVAQRIASVDWQMFAMSLEGLAMVMDGEISAGMSRLDEAATAAVAGDLTDLDAISTVCCYLIQACEQVRDYERAAQWCDMVKQISARWSSRFLFSLCRSHYAGILICRGEWSEAEHELTQLIEDLESTHPVMAGEGIARLAELRRRQGRLDEAAELLRRIEFQPLPAIAQKYVLLGRASLALDQGDPDTAADLAERFLRSTGRAGQVERAAGLEVLLRAQVARGVTDERMGELLSHMQAIEQASATLPLRGSLRFTEGMAAAATGDLDVARRRYEDAVDSFQLSGAPYETGLARLELASVLCALGRVETARAEAVAALEGLREIGADGESSRAVALLTQIQRDESDDTRPQQAPGRLSLREIEVLRLVSHGLTNKEIATELGLSQHTVHRHVSNIRTKLNAPSRAAAATIAMRENLL